MEYACKMRFGSAALRLIAFLCLLTAIMVLASQPAAGLVFLFLIVFFFCLGFVGSAPLPFIPILSKAQPLSFVPVCSPCPPPAR